MKKTIAILPGDGVGPEIVAATVGVLDSVAHCFHHVFSYTYGAIGHAAIEKTGDPFPKATERLCLASDAVLLGAVGHPLYDTDRGARVRPEEGLLRLRRTLGLFTNLRPVHIFPDLVDRSVVKAMYLRSVDFIIVRELIGGIYFGRPRMRVHNGTVAIDTCSYSQEEIVRVSRVAFEIARKRKKHVTSVDKANVLETSRLWRETVDSESASYPDVSVDHLFVDAAAMYLLKRPAQFDVILTENMFGDILSDEASVLVGSIGLLPSASIGHTHALYEPIHGAYNKAAGKDFANPIGAILSAALMLDLSFHLSSEARSVERAVSDALRDGLRTRDIFDPSSLGVREVGTRAMGEEISKRICV